MCSTGRQRLIAAGVLLAVLGVAGCSSSPPVHGVIIGKQYVPAYQTTIWIYLKSGPMPIPINHAACYQLAVREAGGQIGNTCVDEGSYYRVKVGGKW